MVRAPSACAWAYRIVYAHTFCVDTSMCASHGMCKGVCAHSLHVMVPSGLFKVQTCKTPVLRDLQHYSVTCNSAPDPSLCNQPTLFHESSLIILSLLTYFHIDFDLLSGSDFCLDSHISLPVSCWPSQCMIQSLIFVLVLSCTAVADPGFFLYSSYQ